MSADIAHPAGGVIVNCVVVDVVNDRGIDIVHGAVVVELPSAPVSSLITAAHIPEAVIDTTIEADMRTPVAVAPAIAIADERPIRWCPERTNVGSNYPRSWYPIVARGSVPPVSGCPHIVRAGTFRLAIFRQRRRWLFSLDRLLVIVVVGRVVPYTLIVVLVGRSGLGLPGRPLLRGGRRLFCRGLRLRLLAGRREIGLRRI